MRAVIMLLAASALAMSVEPRLRVEVLQSTGGLPAHIAGSFREPLGFQQTEAGRYYVFDRRGHTVYTVDPQADAPRKLAEIGAEAGRLLDPSAFDLDPTDGSFAVADAPGRQERVQIFTATASRLGGFWLPEKNVPRLTLGNLVLNGVGSLQYTGRTLLLNQPGSGSLVTEYAFDGSIVRTFGNLRQTGHEAERDLHVAFNIGLPIVNPAGGYYFVFQSGVPVFRKYDAKGTLLFERHVEGPEIDQYLREMPTVWPRQRTAEGDIIPLVPPAVRTAGADRRGNLWISLTVPFTYVYDPSGDKLRTVQFKGADVLSPNSLSFTKDGRVLVTPGCYEFRPGD
ncbi:MAG: hypothetical protein DMF85_13590 [Acidobacteria bacterium]|nr:MAG: hypothetical protein DMF85_13590 [Acidobacteriota bacterium]